MISVPMNPASKYANYSDFLRREMASMISFSPCFSLISKAYIYYELIYHSIDLDELATSINPYHIPKILRHRTKGFLQELSSLTIRKVLEQKFSTQKATAILSNYKNYRPHQYEEKFLTEFCLNGQVHRWLGLKRNWYLYIEQALLNRAQFWVILLQNRANIQELLNVSDETEPILKFRHQPEKNCWVCSKPWDNTYTPPHALEIYSAHPVVCRNDHCPRSYVHDIPTGALAERYYFVEGETDSPKIINEAKIRRPGYPRAVKMQHVMQLYEGNNIIETVNGKSQDRPTYSYTTKIMWKGSLADDKEIIINLSQLPVANESQEFMIEYCSYNQDKFGLEIKKSPICDGLGVFTKVDILPHTVVACYHGDMYLDIEFPWWVDNDSKVFFGYLNGAACSLIPYEFANVGRFINGATKKIKANLDPCWILVKYNTHYHRVYLVMVSNSRISAGQELFWNYGSNYNTAFDLEMKMEEE